MQFHQLIILDSILLGEPHIQTFQPYSQQDIIWHTSNPKNDQETIERIGNADAILLSRKTPITQEIINACPELQAIFICGTNTKAIDLTACEAQGITVSNVRDYSEEGVIERMLYELLSLFRGRGPYQWQEEPAELSGKTIGIIGMGAIGKLLAQTMLGLNMRVLYHSRTRKGAIEDQGVEFADKKELLSSSDIISLQTPRDVIILGKEDFALMQGKVLINNTLGKAFHEADFRERIALPNNYLIQDMVSGFGDTFQDIDRVIYCPFIAGKTREFIDRLNSKVLDNVQAYLTGKPHSLHVN